MFGKHGKSFFNLSNAIFGLIIHFLVTHVALASPAPSCFEVISGPNLKGSEADLPVNSANITEWLSRMAVADGRHREELKAKSRSILGRVFQQNDLDPLKKGELKIEINRWLENHFQSTTGRLVEEQLQGKEVILVGAGPHMLQFLLTLRSQLSPLEWEALRSKMVIVEKDTAGSNFLAPFFMNSPNRDSDSGFLDTNQIEEAWIQTVDLYDRNAVGESYLYDISSYPYSGTYSVPYAPDMSLAIRLSYLELGIDIMEGTTVNPSGPLKDKIYDLQSPFGTLEKFKFSFAVHSKGLNQPNLNGLVEGDSQASQLLSESEQAQSLKDVKGAVGAHKLMRLIFDTLTRGEEGRREFAEWTREKNISIVGAGHTAFVLAELFGDLPSPWFGKIETHLSSLNIWSIFNLDSLFHIRVLPKNDIFPLFREIIKRRYMDPNSPLMRAINNKNIRFVTDRAKRFIDHGQRLQGDDQETHQDLVIFATGPSGPAQRLFGKDELTADPINKDFPDTHINLHGTHVEADIAYRWLTKDGKHTGQISIGPGWGLRLDLTTASFAQKSLVIGNSQSLRLTLEKTRQAARQIARQLYEIVTH